MTPDADVRDRLVSERVHAEERMTALEAEFRGLVEAGDRTNIDDEHDPEGATIAFERAQVVALIEQARAHVSDINLALAALSRDQYGSCERCGQPISAGRLQARPSARTCIRCAAR